ncbi:MAG: cytochrome c biogenesis protein ResB [Smithella sp.]
MLKKTKLLWSFLSSVQLTIFLLAFIALLAFAGTIIPQRDLAIHMPSPLFTFLNRMQLFDLYHSFPFFLLIGLLSLNLLACLLKSFPAAWRSFKEQPSLPEAADFRNVPEENILRVTNDQQTVMKIIEKIIASGFNKWRRSDTIDGNYLAGSKGGLSLFGICIIHFSILLFIAGALAGFLFGLEGYVNISEKESINTINLTRGKGTMSLPFTVRCDKFILELHENGMPKTYRSDLSFIKNEKIVKQGHLLVNHPLTFEGISFYQASYGLINNKPGAILAIFRNGQEIQNLNAVKGDSLDLPGKDGRVSILRIEENLMNMGPAIKLSITSHEGNRVFWVFQKLNQIIESNPGIELNQVINPDIFRSYRFVMTGMEEKYFTGLQVTHDPGIPLVVLAALLMMAGLILALFFRAQKVWIRVDSDRDFTRISIVCRSYKNDAGSQREIKLLLDSITRCLDGLK